MTQDPSAIESGRTPGVAPRSVKNDPSGISNGWASDCARTTWAEKTHGKPSTVHVQLARVSCWAATPSRHSASYEQSSGVQNIPLNNGKKRAFPFGIELKHVRSTVVPNVPARNQTLPDWPAEQSTSPA